MIDGLHFRNLQIIKKGSLPVPLPKKSHKQNNITKKKRRKHTISAIGCRNVKILSQRSLLSLFY